MKDPLVQREREELGRVKHPHENTVPETIRGMTDAQKREYAVSLAADMEMGYYQDRSGKQWRAAPYNLDEMCRYIGYSPTTAGWLPAFWPPRNQFRRMVALKVTLREAQRRPDTDDENSWLKAALSASVEELLTRLYIRPEAIKDRELVELVTKLARLRASSEVKARAPLAASVGGTQPVAFQRITETYLALPPDERERMRPIYERAIESAKAAIPA